MLPDESTTGWETSSPEPNCAGTANDPFGLPERV